MEFQLTDEGDLDLHEGSTVHLCHTKQHMIYQKIKDSFRVNKGSWPYDLDYGTPWVENPNNNLGILNKVPVAIFNSEIKKSISKIDGVKEILSFETAMNRETRVVQVKVSVMIDNGEILNVSY